MFTAEALRSQRVARTLACSVQIEVLTGPNPMNDVTSTTCQTEHGDQYHEPGDDLTGRVIGCAIEVHRRLGPGLLESAYQRCLASEMRHAGVMFQTEVALPITYRDERLDCGYRMDFVVDNRLVVEIKAIRAIEPIHHAQLVSYLQLSGLPIGLLINFHVPVLRSGIVRRVLTSASSAPLR